MKILAMALVLSMSCMAQSKPVKADPVPVPAPVCSRDCTIPDLRHELISREMINLQQTVSALQAAQAQAAKFLQPSESLYNESSARWSKLLDALRKEFHADGCELTVDKLWDCTKRDKDAKDKADAEKAPAPAVAPAAAPKP